MFAFKSHKINFSSPNATGVFRRGETLSGELRFVLGREIEIRQITVTLKGKASVLWETKQGKASIDHKGKVVYYRDREVLLRAPSGCMFTLFVTEMHVEGSLLLLIAYVYSYS